MVTVALVAILGLLITILCRLLLARYRRHQYSRSIVYLTVEYGHCLGLCVSVHTIVATFNGVTPWKLIARIAKDQYIHRHGRRLFHGKYLSINIGVRNMVRLLCKAGVPLSLIYFNGEPASNLIAKFWPEEL